MSSKQMDNAALVQNEETERQGQYTMHPPGYNPRNQPSMNYNQPVAGYYAAPPVASSGHHTIQMNAGIQQPMVIVENGAEPQTSSALVMSVLNSIFCFWPLGLMGVILAWQARLHVLDRKLGHARHTLTVSWTVNGIGLLFGLVIWGCFIWMMTLYTRTTYSGGY